MKGTGYGSPLDLIKTDQDGRFLSQALWPGDSYKVSFESKIFAKAETPETVGTAGQVHDFGTISLIETSAHIAGRVVGSDGKPIADARVFNQGDGPNPVAHPHSYRRQLPLEGLYSGARYAYGAKRRLSLCPPGRRAADCPAEICVRPQGWLSLHRRGRGRRHRRPLRAIYSGAMSHRTPGTREKPDSFEDQKAFAKRTLVRLWERDGQNGANGSAWNLHPSDGRDRSRAGLEMVGRAWQPLRQPCATRRRERGRDGRAAALKILVDEGGTTSQLVLQELAERFQAIDQEKAKLFAEQAAIQARTLAEPDHTRYLAQAGAVLARAGSPEAGRKLIDEAAEAAAKMGTTGMPGYTRGIVAKALAPLDLKRSLALLEPMKERKDKDRYTGFIVEAIAGSNPERALEFVDSTDPDTSLPQTLKTEIAYAIASDKPDQAMRIVEGMTEGHGAVKHQAEAFGWLAVAIAPRDKSRAFALIDRALALPIDKPREFASYTYFGGALASSAGIALNARRIGYPDMNGALMWVMAARPDGRNSFNDPAMDTLSATIATPLVALLDPAAAETILGQLEARSGLSPAELARIAGENWLTAWALVNVKHAEGLVEAELSSEKLMLDVNSGQSGILRMIEALLTPPSRREEYLREKIARVVAAWRRQVSVANVRRPLPVLCPR